MNRKILSTLGLLCATSMSEDNIFGNSVYRVPKTNPNYRRPVEHKAEQEFTINGQKVTAYSRKDAIKRLKHKKI